MISFRDGAILSSQHPTGVPDKTVLIVKFGQIGDVIMAIPAVYDLHLQGFHIQWVCGKAVYPLLCRYVWIDAVAVDELALLLGSPRRRLLEAIHLWRQVCRSRYDLAVILYYDWRYRLLFAPMRARRVIALSHSRRATAIVSGRHHTDEYRRILLGDPDGCRDRSTPPLRPDRLPDSPLPTSRFPRRIAIVPGGVRPLVRVQATKQLPDQLLRCWPVARYVELAEHLWDRGWEVVLLGSAGDTWVRPSFAHLPTVDCLGTLTLPEVVSLCNACDAVVTHDTGPLHLAGLSDTCLLGIFGPTDPATRVPRRPYASGLWGGRGFACRPCYDGRDFAPCQHNGCMHQVTVADALAELDFLLDARDRGLETPWRVVEPNIHSLVTIEPR